MPARTPLLGVVVVAKSFSPLSSVMLILGTILAGHQVNLIKPRSMNSPAVPISSLVSFFDDYYTLSILPPYYNAGAKSLSWNKLNDLFLALPHHRLTWTSPHLELLFVEEISANTQPTTTYSSPGTAWYLSFCGPLPPQCFIVITFNTGNTKL